MPGGVGHGDGFHVVDGPALHGDPRGGQVDRARRAVLRPDEPELPFLVAMGGGARHPGGLRPPRRLGPELAPPGQELGVGERGAVGHLVRHGAGRAPGRQGLGRAQDHGVGPVGQVQHGDHGARRRRATRQGLESGGQHEQRVRGAALAHVRRQVVDRHSVGEGQLLGQARHGTAVHAGDDQPSDVACFQAGLRPGPGRAPRARGPGSCSRRTAPPRASTRGRRAYASGR